MSLFLNDAQHFTSAGLYTYWNAVDSTIRYCDTLLAQMHIPQSTQPTQKHPIGYQSEHGNRKSPMSHHRDTRDAIASSVDKLPIEM